MIHRLFPFLLLLPLFAMSDCAAQSLTDYRWQNRLVLILAASEDSPFLQDQLNALSGDDPGLQDRKLIVLQLTPTTSRRGLDETKWQPADAALYQTHHRSGEEVLLIGLDGGVKLRQREILTREKLYAAIDAMPMRRAEKNK